jgi:hypothetical protein
MAMIGFGFFDLSGMVIGGVVVVLGALLGAGVFILVRGAWAELTGLQKGVVLTGLVVGGVGLILMTLFLLLPGQPLSLPEVVDANPDLPRLSTDVPDPSLRGDFIVETLTYGSGTDRRRPAFGEDVDLISRAVDGSKLVGNWSKVRTFLWGFNETELPLNGRVWMPQGEGPFPLVLVVHGNHLAEDYSDPGYGYLCDLLASKGNICVSVDENFLNGSGVADFLGFNGLEEENDLRGWLLLEHLALWSDWVVEAGHPFEGRVDLANIALIGHSRGGEAVAIAAAFNDLRHYPDDGGVRFDYGFGLQAVVAIAPVDGQYQPAAENTPLTDINYLVIQGTHDMDVRSFAGYNTYERLRFSGEGDFFKVAVVIYGGNHGQFNTVWGDNDLGTPIIWLFNRGGLLPEEEQQKAAQVLIGGFLDITLHGQAAYLPMFENLQAGMGWLPDTLYFNAYGDSSVQVLADYEEDIDLETASMAGVTLVGEGLETWREDRVHTKWGKMHTNSAVYLGWRGSTVSSQYTLELNASLPTLTPEDVLIFSAAQTRRTPGSESEPSPADFLIEIQDANGEKASLTLSSVAPLQPAPEAEIAKLPFLYQDPISEVLFQTYQFQLADFLEENPDLDLLNLKKISFIFNRMEHAEIVLDDIGFRMAGSASDE